MLSSHKPQLAYTPALSNWYLLQTRSAASNLPDDINDCRIALQQNSINDQVDKFAYGSSCDEMHLLFSAWPGIVHLVWSVWVTQAVG